MSPGEYCLVEAENASQMTGSGSFPIWGDSCDFSLTRFSPVLFTDDLVSCRGKKTKLHDNVLQAD